MKVVPQLLYQHKNVRKIMVDGLSCIVHKTMDTIDTHRDHYVASHVISIVLKGTLNLESYYEGERYQATDSQIVFIPKGRYMISDVLPQDGAFEALFFFFDDELVTQFLTPSKHNVPNEGKPNPIFAYSPNIRAFAESILSIYPVNISENKAITKLKLLELLHLIYSSEHKERLVQLLYNLQTKPKRNLKDLMLLNFDKPLSVADYAFLTGRNLSAFNRDFKLQFDCSPKKWLIQERLKKAEHLFMTTTSTVNEVSLEVGYDNVSHFIDAFGKQYQISPKQFIIKNRIDKST